MCSPMQFLLTIGSSVFAQLTVVTKQTNTQTTPLLSSNRPQHAMHAIRHIQMVVNVSFWHWVAELNLGWSHPRVGLGWIWKLQNHTTENYRNHEIFRGLGWDFFTGWIEIMHQHIHAIFSGYYHIVFLTVECRWLVGLGFRKWTHVQLCWVGRSHQTRRRRRRILKGEPQPQTAA